MCVQTIECVCVCVCERARTRVCVRLCLCVCTFPLSPISIEVGILFPRGIDDGFFDHAASLECAKNEHKAQSYENDVEQVVDGTRRRRIHLGHGSMAGVWESFLRFCVAVVDFCLKNQLHRLSHTWFSGERLALPSQFGSLTGLNESRPFRLKSSLGNWEWMDEEWH